MSVDQDKGQLRASLIEHAAQLNLEANAILTVPEPTEEGLYLATIYTEGAHRSLRLARHLPQVLFSTPAITTDTDKRIPTSELQEELVITLLTKAYHGEQQDLRSISKERYQRKNPNRHKYVDQAVGGIMGGLFKARSLMIARLEQYHLDPQLPYPRAYAQRLLKTAHIVPGHEEMTTQELLAFLVKNRDYERLELEEASNAEKREAKADLAPITPEATINQETPKQQTREEAIIFAFLEPDEQGNFKNNSLEEIVRQVYKKELAGLEDKKLAARINRYKNVVTTTKGNFIAKLRTVISHQVESRRTIEVFEQAKNIYPTYADLTAEEFIALLKRKAILKDGKIINLNPINLSVDIMPSSDNLAEMQIALADTAESIGKLVVTSATEELDQTTTRDLDSNSLPRKTHRTPIRSNQTQTVKTTDRPSHLDQNHPPIENDNEQFTLLNFFSPAEFLVLGTVIMVINAEESKKGERAKADTLGVHLAKPQLDLMKATGKVFAGKYQINDIDLRFAQGSLWQNIQHLITHPDTMIAISQMAPQRDNVENVFRRQILATIGRLSITQLYAMQKEAISEALPLKRKPTDK